MLKRLGYSLFAAALLMGSGCKPGVAPLLRKAPEVNKLPEKHIAIQKQNEYAKLKKAPSAYRELAHKGWVSTTFGLSAREAPGGVKETSVMGRSGGGYLRKKRAMVKMSRSMKAMPTKGDALKLASTPPAGRVIGKRPMPIAQASPLKAGETDDNKNFDHYLLYHQKNQGLIPKKFHLNIKERYVFEVSDSKGKTLPNCRVVVGGDDKLIWKGRTDAHGKLLFFPRAVQGTEKIKEFLVSFNYDGKSIVRKFSRLKNGATKPTKVTLPVQKKLDKVRVEVLFLLDTTGSMSDEIARVQSTLLAITAKIRKFQKQPEIRYGMVLYRDRTDEYVTRRFPFTSDVKKFDEALKQVRAAGGGDVPEAMNMGLYTAIEQMKWTSDALRMVFLVADAPPHLDYTNDVPYSKTLQAAVTKGIKIFPTAASGLDNKGSFVMRQMAQYTGGKFLFIEYNKGTAASHGVSAPHKSNNLDDLIVRIVRSELTAYTK